MLLQRELLGTYIPINLIKNYPNKIKNKNGIEKLTKREKDVALLLQHGMSNKLMAHKLKISENTIKKHISNIMEKLKVTNRSKIIIVLLSN